MFYEDGNSVMHWLKIFQNGRIWSCWLVNIRIKGKCWTAFLRECMAWEWLIRKLLPLKSIFKSVTYTRFQFAWHAFCVDRSPCGQKKMSQLPWFSEPVNKNRKRLNGKGADLEILVMARHKVMSSTPFWNARDSQERCHLCL